MTAGADGWGDLAWGTSPRPAALRPIDPVCTFLVLGMLRWLPLLSNDVQAAEARKLCDEGRASAVALCAQARAAEKVRLEAERQERLRAAPWHSAPGRHVPPRPAPPIGAAADAAAANGIHPVAEAPGFDGRKRKVLETLPVGGQQGWVGAADDGGGDDGAPFGPLPQPAERGLLSPSRHLQTPAGAAAAAAAQRRQQEQQQPEAAAGAAKRRKRWEDAPAAVFDPTSQPEQHPQHQHQPQPQQQQHHHQQGTIAGDDKRAHVPQQAVRPAGEAAPLSAAGSAPPAAAAALPPWLKPHPEPLQPRRSPTAPAINGVGSPRAQGEPLSPASPAQLHGPELPLSPQRQPPPNSSPGAASPAAVPEAQPAAQPPPEASPVAEEPLLRAASSPPAGADAGAGPPEQQAAPAPPDEPAAAEPAAATAEPDPHEEQPYSPTRAEEEVPPPPPPPPPGAPAGEGGGPAAGPLFPAGSPLADAHAKTLQATRCAPLP